MLADLLDDDFFRDHWHRQPARWRGAASTVLEDATGPVRVDHLVADGWIDGARNNSPELARTLLRERPALQFLEGVDAAPVDRLVAEARSLFGTEHVWFDVVRTAGLGSIGSHFDDSDNFVVQLDGIKQWRLADASAVPIEQHERRMGGDPGAAPFVVATPSWTCTAQVGDVVYLPFGWPHHGIARTPSLSISLVVKHAVR